MQEKLQELNKIINNISNTTSRIEKENIIRENSNNHYFIETCKFLYDSLIVTGLSSKKIEKESCFSNYSFNDLFAEKIIVTYIDVLEYLKVNNTGRDVDIRYVNDYINEHKEYSELLKKIFTKELKLGMDATTLNKVMGEGFVKVFNVMLADNYFENTDYINDKEFILSTKMDGCVSGDTLVETNIGLKTISSLENSYSNIEVKSYNEKTGRIEFKKVANFMKGLSKNAEWYEIETVIGRKLKITGNDLVMTRNGWKEVRYLTSEDEVFVDEIEGSSK
jgi:hypothetical protein